MEDAAIDSVPYRLLPTYQNGFHCENQIKKMMYTRFGSTGLLTSILGFGGAPLALCYATPQEKDGIDAVVTAIKWGVNYIDTAPFYGQGSSERLIGKALKEIPRNAYYLATKVGRYGPSVCNMFDFSAVSTLKSVEESLNRLGVNCIDIIQVHDLEFAPSIDIILKETLPALHKLKEDGKAHFIGITGYPLSKLKEVLERSWIPIDAVLSYCRHTLFDEGLNSYIEYFKSKNVAVINAACLGMGLLTPQGPPAWHPAPSQLQRSCRAALQCSQDNKVDLSKISLMHSISNPSIHVNLVGMDNKQLLCQNFGTLECMRTGLTEHEKSVRDQIMRNFEACPVTEWENKEVEKYWKKMKALSQKN